MHCEFGHRLLLLEKSFFFLPFESQSTSVNCALQDPTSIGDPLKGTDTEKNRNVDTNGLWGACFMII